MGRQTLKFHEATAGTLGGLVNVTRKVMYPQPESKPSGVLAQDGSLPLKMKHASTL